MQPIPSGFLGILSTQYYHGPGSSIQSLIFVIYNIGVLLALRFPSTTQNLRGMWTGCANRLVSVNDMNSLLNNSTELLLSQAFIICTECG